MQNRDDKQPAKKAGFSSGRFKFSREKKSDKAKGFEHQVTRFELSFQTKANNVEPEKKPLVSGWFWKSLVLLAFEVVKRWLNSSNFYCKYQPLPRERLFLWSGHEPLQA